MKIQTFTFVLLCFLFLLFTSCKTKKAVLSESTFSLSSSTSMSNIESNVNCDADVKVSDEDFALYSTDNSVIIKSADSVDEIKNMLGTSTLEKSDYGATLKYQGVTFCLRNEKYAGGFVVQPYDDATMLFKTLRNIKLDSTLQQIKSAYGEPTETDDDTQKIYYVYKKDGDIYSLLSKKNLDEKMDEYYYIQFVLNTDQMVSQISIGDYNFVFFWK